MASYHLSAKFVKRSAGQSAIAHAAYVSREKVENELTGEVHDYSRAKGLLFSGIFAPKNAPDWAHDRARLWNEVERFENRKNSQLARSITIALPHELTDEQRKHLLMDYVRETFVRKGMVADVNLHAPNENGDQRNYHAHIVLTLRGIGPDGFEGNKVREWSEKRELERWREKLAQMTNRYLKRHCHNACVDHRTLEAQGVDREATKHMGPYATKLLRNGKYSELVEQHQRIIQTNKEFSELAQSLTKELQEIEAALLDIKARDAEARIKADNEAKQREIDERKAKASRKDATMYDRPDMVSQQQDANRDFKKSTNVYRNIFSYHEKQTPEPKKEKSDFWAEQHEKQNERLARERKEAAAQEKAKAQTSASPQKGKTHTERRKQTPEPSSSQKMTQQRQAAKTAQQRKAAEAQRLKAAQAVAAKRQAEEQAKAKAAALRHDTESRKIEAAQAKENARQAEELRKYEEQAKAKAAALRHDTESRKVEAAQVKASQRQADELKEFERLALEKAASLRGQTQTSRPEHVNVADVISKLQNASRSTTTRTTAPPQQEKREQQQKRQNDEQQRRQQEPQQQGSFAGRKDQTTQQREERNARKEQTEKDVREHAAAAIQDELERLFGKPTSSEQKQSLNRRKVRGR